MFIQRAEHDKSRAALKANIFRQYIDVKHYMFTTTNPPWQHFIFIIDLFIWESVRAVFLLNTTPSFIVVLLKDIIIKSFSILCPRSSSFSTPVSAHGICGSFSNLQVATDFREPVILLFY